IADHECGHRFRHVVGPIAEGDDLSVRTGGVVDAADRTIGNEELVDLAIDLSCGERTGRRRRYLEVAAAARGRVRIVPALRVFVGETAGWRPEVDWHERRLSDEHDFSPHRVPHAAQGQRQLLVSRPEVLGRSTRTATTPGHFGHKWSLRKD